MSKEKYIAFRDETTIIELIDKIARERGIDRSDFIREAIRRRLADLSFFNEETKKALGIKEASQE